MELDRRTLLKGIGLTIAGGTLPFLAACGDDGDTVAPVTAGTGASAATATTTTVLQKVDKLRLAGGQWGYPTPFLYTRAPGLAYTFMLFDTLTWKDGSGDVIPWLATKWATSTDGLTWTFTLNEKASWHDGRPVTAEDVVFTFDYLLTGAAKAAPSGIVGKPDAVAKTVATDAKTVVFTLNKPYAPFAVAVAGKVPIMPKHIWATVTEPDKYRDAPALVGSGPYKVDSIDETAGTYRFVANESFHLGVPVVRALEFVPAKDELLSLSQGALDGASPASEEGLPDGALKEFQNDKFKILTQEGDYARVMQFNLTKGFPYDNVAFRQALAYAIDRKDLLKRILLGDGKPGSLGGLAPTNPWTAAGLPAYDLDLAKAKTLLDGIGLKDANGDGMRELPDGKSFTMTIQVSARDKAQTAELVKEYLKAVGIDVKLNSLDGAAADQAAARGAYDVALVGYSLGSDPDSLRVRLSANVKSTSFSRIQGYSNPQFEQAAAAQLVALSSDQRKAAVTTMQQLVAQDVPAIPLYHATTYFVHRTTPFNSYYFTPGGIWGGYPGILNRHSFVTGKTKGF